MPDNCNIIVIRNSYFLFSIIYRLFVKTRYVLIPMLCTHCSWVDSIFDDFFMWRKNFAFKHGSQELQYSHDKKLSFPSFYWWQSFRKNPKYVSAHAHIVPWWPPSLIKISIKKTISLKNLNAQKRQCDLYKKYSFPPF